MTLIFPKSRGDLGDSTVGTLVSEWGHCRFTATVDPQREGVDERSTPVGGKAKGCTEQE